MVFTAFEPPFDPLPAPSLTGSSSLSTLFKVDFLAFRGVAGAFFFTGEAVVLFVVPVPVLLFLARKPFLRAVRRLNADPVFVYPVSLATASKSV